MNAVAIEAPASPAVTETEPRPTLIDQAKQQIDKVEQARMTEQAKLDKLNAEILELDTFLREKVTADSDVYELTQKRMRLTSLHQIAKAQVTRMNQLRDVDKLRSDLNYYNLQNERTYLLEQIAPLEARLSALDEEKERALRELEEKMRTLETYYPTQQRKLELALQEIRGRLSVIGE